MKLTDKIVAALPIPATGNRRTPDSDVTGLAVQVSAAGHRAFVFRYRVRGGQRQLTIGAFPTWTTTAARNRAKDLRRMVDQGEDPLMKEAAERVAGMTLGEFWARVYEPLHITTKRPSWARDSRSMMKHDILPRLGGRAVRDIDQADVAALHRAVSKRASTRANRVRALLSHLFTFAERAHILESGERIEALRPRFSNPCRDIARNHEEARRHYLDLAQLTALSGVLDRRRDRLSANLVRFLLLTGARFGEAAGATWAQFDLDQGIWTKPSSHTKQKRTHTVPLSAPARALLAAMRERSASPYLFPGPTGRPLMSIKTFWKSVTEEADLDGFRVHDLRHSYASVLASGGASLVLIGQLLGHTQQATTQRYAHLLDGPQREATERAGAVISGQPLGDVVPMRGIRR